MRDQYNKGKKNDLRETTKNDVNSNVIVNLVLCYLINIIMLISTLQVLL